MSRHAEQLVGALFDVLEEEGHTRARQQLIETYRPRAASERSQPVDRLVEDFAVLLTRYLTAEEELEVLTGDTEMALVHSTGTGLWLMRWIVHGSGGRLRVNSDPSEGTRVAIGLRHPTGESVGPDGT